MARFEMKASSRELELICSGLWDVHHLSGLQERLAEAVYSARRKQVVFDLENIVRFDTAAGLMLWRLRRQLKSRGIAMQIRNAAEDTGRILEMTRTHGHPDAVYSVKNYGPLESLGRFSVSVVHDFIGILGFIGHTFAILAAIVIGLRPMRMKEFLYQINESAIKALWIIALTMFLVGVVVAYQSAVQLRTYGANIFIVDMLGISILRELSPMLTAIIVAGRSGSAFAAQIGVMKLTEEIDAMRTMGFDLYAFLVVPRLLALIVMMPILIFFADMFGLLGGMVVAHTELDITPMMFMERFEQAVKLKHFWVGLIKGPFFAVLIASIGIYRGLAVKNDTESIGINTTRSVVEAIFIVIICDALFSIVFTRLGF